MIFRALVFAAFFAAPAPRHFVVRVTDAETGRGVPLVCLKVPNAVEYWTDSGGIAALDEPSFEGREVFIEVRSHGYEYTGKTLLGPGLNLKVQAGGSAAIQVRRTMVAERLVRLTGEGIWRDSLLAGFPAPVTDPAPNGWVLGQDTVSAALYSNRIFWIWGDTIGPAFFNGSVSGATSDPREDPSSGIHYRYFTDARGSSRAVLPLPRKGLVWIEGLFTARDPRGRERLLATYTRQQGLKPPDERGVAFWNDSKEVFEPWIELPWRESHISSHPFLYRDSGIEYWYHYPWLRVRNDWKCIETPACWERRQTSLPKSPRFSSMAWNEYRGRFVVFFENFGEVYYAEADRPEGPFTTPVLIVRHNHYNFYNVAHHPFFNQDGGRIVFFEGTYTDSFTDAKQQTPRYNYNQILYRLRLDDPRLTDAWTKPLSR